MDELGGLREAVLAAGELAGISGEPEVVSIGQPPSFLEILLSALWEGNPLEALRPDRGPSLEYRALR